ncbi:MAG: ABC transporter ATP-binding protein [Christensenellales bacterium]
MKLIGVSLNYGEKKVFSDFSLEIPDKKVTCIMGASGCGKTSLLNIITGSVVYNGIVEKESDKISYVFQSPVLLNHLTVGQNIDFVIKNQIKNKREREKIIEDVLKKVELCGEKDAYPSSLSGGMAQRVSLARAFAYDSDVMLMDEPFKALDISLKKRIIGLFSYLNEEYGRTTVLVTHDIDEAILLSDKIIVLGNNTVLYEVELPRDKNRSVTDFPEAREEIYKIL